MVDFWNSGLLNVEDESIDDDAAFTNDSDEGERDHILKVTEGGIVSTPPRDKDEEDDFWAGINELHPTVTTEENASGSYDESFPFEPMPYLMPDEKNMGTQRNDDLPDQSSRWISEGWSNKSNDANGSYLNEAAQEQLESMRRSLTEQDMEDALAMSEDFESLDEEEVIKEILSGSNTSALFKVEV